MKINGQNYQTIWLKADDPTCIQIIDQRYLPHEFIIEDLRTSAAAAHAIRDMHVRGAPLIGATAAFGLYLASLEAAQTADYDDHLEKAAQKLRKARPTAVDLFHAVERSLTAIHTIRSPAGKTEKALEVAHQIAEESVDCCRRIGEHGLALIQALSKQKGGQTIHILTHCNAGWLACVDYGTATAPIYLAHEQGIDLHVWVDETRPRNQGARLTAFELLHQGVPHTIITDNLGGHLMQHKRVDLVIVGSDRTTRNGDVANKIGTYLKALAAKDNEVPFYVALPFSSFDWKIRDGLKEIPIEQRGEEEVKYIQGWNGQMIEKILLTPENSPAINYGFDVTPARLVSGLITERGICEASEAGILRLYPERR